MRETWYILEDDSSGNPRDIRPDADGKLVHKDGRKVAYAPHGPRSRGVDVDEAKQMRPQSSGKGYVTRESRAEPDSDLTAARAEYQRSVGKRPFPGWDAETLRAKMAAASAKAEGAPPVDEDTGDKA